MQITVGFADWLMRQAAIKLKDGEARFYEGVPGRAFGTLLAVAPLDSFVASGDGLLSGSFAETQVIASGTVGSCQLVSAAGEVLANVTVDDKPGADLVANRLDVQRDAPFTLSALTLRLPRGA